MGLVWADTGRVHVGTVTAFDDAVGTGEVTLGDEALVVPFHCTAIAGGSRTIDVGAAVAVTLSATALGVVEAARLTPVG